MIIVKSLGLRSFYCRSNLWKSFRWGRCAAIHQGPVDEGFIARGRTIDLILQEFPYSLQKSLPHEILHRDIQLSIFPHSHSIPVIHGVKKYEFFFLSVKWLVNILFGNHNQQVLQLLSSEVNQLSRTAARLTIKFEWDITAETCWCGICHYDVDNEGLLFRHTLENVEMANLKEDRFSLSSPPTFPMSKFRE
ncbi:hypothetical protein SJAG_06256 [Schizosaccharomyces japonicus yFS275]|uniref:Uncharacterized protein n=1 Tax=Schizosaccharomyces japonicus (strain yFS275 / FY16936) TaxID=402676 RepID=T0S156_SCHJY|nr:hypothetical protein SJAG_06256 [Schizosaccharomyces japonicus yFS275]EQC53042.1 hypothetical protein SJAG_06256 [Schizosaccharomyces japonicus yFS275]